MGWRRKTLTPWIVPQPFNTESKTKWSVVLEKTPESSLDSKEIKPVNPKGSQPWIFTERTDAEAPVLRPPDAKNWLIGRDPDAGKDGRWEEKGTTEDGMVGWHHWLKGHEFEQAPGDGEGQGNLACCSPRGGKESNTTEWLNNNKTRYLSLQNLNWYYLSGLPNNQ